MNGLSWISQLGDSSMGVSASIHELVSATLAKLGLPAPVTVIQTMLMKDGYFEGHKFRHDGGYAVFLAGGNTIEFFDEQGTPMTTATFEETGAAA